MQPQEVWFCLSVRSRLIFHFPDLIPGKGKTHAFLAEDYYFRVLRRLSKFLLQVTKLRIRGQIRVKFHFVQLNPKNANSYVCFSRKLQFLSPYKAIEIPYASNFK